MKVRGAWNYLNFSNFKISLDLNPFVWSFKFLYEGPSESNPALRVLYVRLIMLSVIVVIDDGSYKLISSPEDIEAIEEA